MKRLREFLSRFDIYDGLTFGLFACLLAFALPHWHNFPVHMDSAYHMGVTSGFASAGGVALRSFWEFAPTGRAQLYPPLLHILMFALTRCGFSIVTAVRLVSFGAFPLLFLTGWYGMRKIFSSRAAFYTAVLLSSCYMLFWHSAVESAASLVLIFTPLIFVAVERNRKIAAAVLLALALYSHLTLGHLVAFGLLIYAVHRRNMFKEIITVLAGAYLLWLPWGIQILTHRSSLSFSSPGATGTTVHLLIWAVALAGFVYCYFKKDNYYLLPAFLLGMVPIVFFYPDRFWNAHVFLPLAMLGGVALSALHGFLRERASGLIRNRTAVTALITVAMLIPVALFLFVDPVYSAGGGMQGGPGMGRQQGLQPPGQQGANSNNQLQQSPMPPGQQGTNQNNQPLQQGGEATTIQIQGQPNGPNLQNPPTDQGGPGNAGATGGPGMSPGGMMGNGMPPGPGGPGGNTGLRTAKTTLLSLLSSSGNGRGQSISSSLIDADTLKLAEIIKANSTAGQIVYTSDGSLGNLITGLTGRASTSGMFHEVSSDGASNQSGGSTRNASLLVVQSSRQMQGQGAVSTYTGGGLTADAAGGAGMQTQGNIDTSQFKLVGTAGTYSVYLNSAVTAKVTDHGTVIPWFAVFLLLALALAAILFDWFRPERGKPAGAADGLNPAGGADGWKPTNDPNDNVTLSNSAGNREVLAIVPCFNEAESVAGVVDELHRVAPFADVLVVDDGSKDRTDQVAREAGASVLSHRRNAGVGAAVRAGMSYALYHGYRFAVQVDGDGQHDPAFISSLLAPIESDSCDLTVGSRFLGTHGYRLPPVRRAGTRLLSAAVTAVTGQRATDTTSGFRAMNRRALYFLVDHYPNDYPETASLVRLSKTGIRWVEAPVTMRKREHGRSSIRGLGCAVFMARVLAYVTLDALTIKPQPGPAGGAVSMERE